MSTTEQNLDAVSELMLLHPADVADRLQRMPEEDALELFLQLPGEQSARVLGELDGEFAKRLLPEVPNDRLVECFRRLPHHVVADLAVDMPQEKQWAVLAGLPMEEARSVMALLRYPEDTAGGIMRDRFISLRTGQSLQQAQDMLRSRADQRTDDVSYLYVTEEGGKMVGVMSLRDLVFGSPDRRVEEVMNKDFKWLPVDADQEQIAREFGHYHYLGLPVLDYSGRLVGVVKVSDVLHVAQMEATEDMQLMVGLSGEERSLTPWQTSVRKRLPWLYLNLGTAFLAALVVAFFESTIAAWTALAVFLPIVAGQGGNAGMQTLTVIIRDMALGELSKGDGRRALIKEAILALINGIAIGLVVGLIGFAWKGSFTLGWVVGAAMVLNQMAAALSGVLIPFGLKWLKVDPALAASIFVTTVTDVGGFFFFLGLAALALRWAT